MALTSEQNIPDKPKEKPEPWTFRRLFPFMGAVTNLAKIFVNPFDVLLGYLVVILSIAELLGRSISWPMWILTGLIFLAAIVERYGKIIIELKDKPEEVK